MTEKLQPQTEWKSPRKIEEERKAHRNERFNYWMGQVDKGELTEADAILKCEEELGEAS